MMHSSCALTPCCAMQDNVISWRLRDVPELGYHVTDKPSRAASCWSRPRPQCPATSSTRRWKFLCCAAFSLAGVVHACIPDVQGPISHAGSHLFPSDL